MVGHEALAHEVFHGWALRAGDEALEAKVRHDLLARVVVRILGVAPDAVKIEERGEVGRGGDVGSWGEQARQGEGVGVEVIEVRGEDGVPDQAGVAVVHQYVVVNVFSKGSC